MGRWPRGLCPSLAPGSPDKQMHARLGTPSPTLLRVQTLSLTVPGTPCAFQRTYPSKEEAPGQHSSVAEAEVW